MLHASSSVIRLYESGEALLNTLILLVLIVAKVNCRHTLLLPDTLPPGVVTQFAPSQYCTSNPCKPKLLNVIVSVGVAGF